MPNMLSHGSSADFKLKMSFIPVIKAVFSASLLQSSVSHDPSEITQYADLLLKKHF